MQFELSRLSRRRFLHGVGALTTLSLLPGCGKRETRVDAGIRDQVLHVGNGTEPQDLDPHTITGDIEHSIVMSLIEGLITEAPDDLHPVPGVAETWDISPDGTIYTFHFRHNARWSNGEPVTAQDFAGSFERMLLPELAAEYSYMLFPMKNAEAFNKGELKDFSQVGAKVLDEHTLQITLHSATPYFLSLLTHNSWFPVHLPTVKKFGGIADRSNRWTLPGNFVGNGAFRLKEWKLNGYVLVEKSPTYWDSANVRLNKIYFYPTENIDAEERAFRAGMLHITKDVPQTKIEVYKRDHPELIRCEPILTTYYYRFNVTKPPLNDKRVRQALAMSIDRDLIVKKVTRGGQVPAYNLTPPGIAGYVATAKIVNDLAHAKQLLAEAGYPDGKNFPEVSILFNTHEGHKAVAEALQAMWMKNLNIKVALRNEEWKVFLKTTQNLDYQISRMAWGGDYVDPNSFLDLMVTDGGNNETGWSNKEYDRLITEASRTGDMKKRFALFQQAEAILVDEVPIMPIYFYTRPTLIRPSVKNFFPTVLDLHPWKYVYLEPVKT
jgi:oligopeptide transport system substrate-binding protein